jgi:hypothetical protein
MTPVSLTPRRTFSPASPELIHSAGIVRDAAQALAEERFDTPESARFRHVADRLTSALNSSRRGQGGLLMISPAVTERSGRNRTLLEMIAEDPGDDETRFRLAKLLLRALSWRPETLPMPPA